MDHEKRFDFKALEFYVGGHKVNIDAEIKVTLMNTHFNNGLLPLKVDVHNPTNAFLDEHFQIGLEIPLTCIKAQITDYVVTPNGAKMKLAELTSIFARGWKSVLFDFKIRREEMVEDKPFRTTLRIFKRNDSFDIPFQISLALGYTD